MNKIPDFRSSLQKRGERKIASVVQRMKRNVKQGHADWKAGKMKYYGTINPFK